MTAQMTTRFRQVNQHALTAEIVRSTIMGNERVTLAVTVPALNIALAQDGDWSAYFEIIATYPSGITAAFSVAQSAASGHWLISAVTAMADNTFESNDLPALATGTKYWRSCDMIYWLRAIHETCDTSRPAARFERYFSSAPAGTFSA